jgi:hypothetical protein
MTDLFKSDKDFKEAIGAFIIAFSEFEYGLVFLCSMTDFDPRQSVRYILKYLGYPFERKLQHLTEFIDEHLQELQPIWTKIKADIEQINTERRFLVHGFMNYSLPGETITTHVKGKKRILTKIHTLKDIKVLTDKLHHLNTGKMGIRGEFDTVFRTARFDNWNALVNDESKVIFKINGETVTGWKGK